jgi:hypothetical protein
MSSKEGASRTGAALALSVVAPGGPTTLARLVDDYLAAGRAAGAASRTIRFSYGFLLREAFLPWVPDHGLTESAQVDNAVLDRFAVHMRDHGGSVGRSPRTPSGPT